MMSKTPRFNFRAPRQLAILGMACVLLLAGIYHLSIDRITISEQVIRLEKLNYVLVPERFDNELSSDYVTIAVPENLRIVSPIKVYRAKLNGVPSAYVVEAASTEAYNGEMQLLVAIDNQFSIISVISLAHQETPGLGDRIDRQRGDWLSIFAQKSAPQSASDPAWQLRRDGGELDQISGATITSRAALKLVHRVRAIIAAHSAEIETAASTAHLSVDRP